MNAPHPTRVRTRLAVLPLLLLALAACGGDEPAADGTVVDEAAPGAAGAAAPAASTTPAVDDRGGITEEDIGGHRLSMEGIRRWAQGSVALSRAAQDNPELRNSLEGDANDQPGAMLERIRAQPKLVAALREAGVSPREYVLTTLAYLQAGFANMALEMNPEAELPPQVNRENVDFLRQNRAELERLQAELRAANPDLVQAEEEAPEEAPVGEP